MAQIRQLKDNANGTKVYPITRTQAVYYTDSNGSVDLTTKLPKMETDSKVKITTDSTDNNYAKVYVVKQGGSQIGRINIPKDLVVSEGSVVTNPTGQPAGTYIK